MYQELICYNELRLFKENLIFFLLSFFFKNLILDVCEEDPPQMSVKAGKNTRGKKIALLIPPTPPPRSFSLSHSPQGSIRK